MDQKGQQLVSDACSEKARVVVRRIVSVRNSMARDVGVDARATSTNERTNERAVCRRQHTEGRDGSGAKQAHDDRFRPIVGMVGERNAIGALTSSSALESLLPGATRPIVKIPARRDIHPRDAEGYVELCGERFGALELPPGARTEPVIDAVCHERDFEACTQQGERMQERH